MRVKRYIVDTMPEAMQHIRTDLGTDAVILSTKETKVGGFLGMFTRKKIEVIAAVEQAEKAKGSASARPNIIPSVPSGAVPKAYQRTAEQVKPAAPSSKPQVSNADNISGAKEEEDYNRFAAILSQVAASEQMAREQRADNQTSQTAATTVLERNMDLPESAASPVSMQSSGERQGEPLTSRLGISESE